ncbi:MAG: CBS domain-containing protein, partial [Cyanobacteria bacterium J06642_11]
MADAHSILLRYGHSGLCVVNDADQLQGMISRRDIDLALHHGFDHASVQGHMTHALKTITPQTPLNDMQALMVTYDVEHLPVLDGEALVGIVTRTDILRQMGAVLMADASDISILQSTIYQSFQTALQTYATAPESQDLWTLINIIAEAAQQRGWHLYVVGGAVRDLLLASQDGGVSIKDIDLVVDSFRSPVTEGAGVVLAQQLQRQYPDADLQIHGEFKTAALVWPEHSGYGPLMIDIATARTEFYPYPAANPEVEPSSIHQDLYRRDFTMNALAMCLTEPQPGRLLDFFGGALDIQQRQVRVLHANSFIEDPTRIFRAVRFAVRLGFSIDAQTESFIRYAMDSGIYAALQLENSQLKLPALQTRLKAELAYILQADYWSEALGLLDHLGALRCLHTSLSIDTQLWHQIHRVGPWQKRFVAECGKDMGIPQWLMRLEVLLARVDVGAQIAINLRLPQSSIQRLQQLGDIEPNLLTKFAHKPRPSSIYQTLVSYDLPTLLLVSVRYPKRLGSHIWCYFTKLIHVRSPIDGHYLKQLGYVPGPHYRRMLTALTHAVLDG